MGFKWKTIQIKNKKIRDEIIEEIGVFIDNLQVTGYIKSDHILNLLMEIEGKMPQDKEKCLNIINQYLSLPDEERLNFKFGKRAGYYNKLADLSDTHKYSKVVEAMNRIASEESGSMDKTITKLKDSFIQVISMAKGFRNLNQFKHGKAIKRNSKRKPIDKVRKESKGVKLRG